MINCPSCGKLNDDTSRHCGFCGVRISEIDDTRKRTMLGMAIPFNSMEEDDDDDDDVQTTAPTGLPQVTSLNPKLDGIPAMKKAKASLRSQVNKPAATLIMGAVPFEDEVEPSIPGEDAQVANPLTAVQTSAQKMLTLDGWPSPVKFDPVESVSESQSGVASEDANMAFDDTAPAKAPDLAAIDEAIALQQEIDAVPASISSPDQPAIRSQEALADTLEANRFEMQQAIKAEHRGLPPEVKNAPEEAVKPIETMRAAQVSSDASMGGAPKASPAARNTLRETTPVRSPETSTIPKHTYEDEEEAPSGFRYLQWALVTALVVVLVGIAVMAVVYYFFLDV